MNSKTFDVSYAQELEQETSIKPDLFVSGYTAVSK